MKLVPRRMIAPFPSISEAAGYLRLSIHRYPPEAWSALVEAAGLLPLPAETGVNPLLLLEAERPLRDSRHVGEPIR
jgi:hypothetical protein